MPRNARTLNASQVSALRRLGNSVALAAADDHDLAVERVVDACRVYREGGASWPAPLAST